LHESVHVRVLVYVFIDVLLDVVRGAAAQQLFDQELGKLEHQPTHTPRGWASGRQRTAAVAVAAGVDLSVKLRH
jgi:hypothetical protein